MTLNELSPDQAPSEPRAAPRAIPATAPDLQDGRPRRSRRAYGRGVGVRAHANALCSRVHSIGQQRMDVWSIGNDTMALAQPVIGGLADLGGPRLLVRGGRALLGEPFLPGRAHGRSSTAQHEGMKARGAGRPPREPGCGEFSSTDPGASSQPRRRPATLSSARARVHARNRFADAADRRSFARQRGRRWTANRRTRAHDGLTLLRLRLEHAIAFVGRQ